MACNQLTDDEWDLLEKLVKQSKSMRGRPPTKHRQIFNAIFWVAKTGQPWRALPDELGKWNTVYRQFKRWSDAGLWQSIIETLETNEALAKVMSELKRNALKTQHLAIRNKADYTGSQQHQNTSKRLEEEPANI
jgi:transposase